MKIPRRALWALTIIACISFLVMVGESRAEITKEQAKSGAVARAKTIGTVSSTQVQGSTLEAAQTALWGSVQPLPGQDEAAQVYVVTSRGKFKDTEAKVPRGVGAPAGTVLEEIYDQATGIRLGLHLGGEPTATIARHRARKASWGAGCSTSNGHHCYALTTWLMNATNEKVRGAESDINTYAMNVPDWSGGGFVDNELWVVFPGTRSPVNGEEYWVELGQEAGSKGDCCTLRWFTGWNRAQGLDANWSPWTMPYNNFARYRTDSQMNNVWCFGIEGNPAGCIGGFPLYAKRLDVGIEVATNIKPVNGMQEQSNAVWTNGTTHPWNYAVWEKDPGFCMQSFSRENPPRYYYGNMQAGTC